MPRTTTGRIVGEKCGPVTAFRGIRYGRLAGGLRFDSVSAAAKDSLQDLREFPAIFPQRPSRLDTLLGSAWRRHPQAEDAFLLNVWAPSGASNLPVLFYIHGGGFVSGGGVIPWYAGSRIARDCDVVVVTMNYRLGPLADLLVADAESSANRAVDDLLQALRWVRENISAFGGDADNMIVAGQSAGAFYGEILAVVPESRDMIRRLCLMSTAGIPAASRERTRSLSREVIENLNGADPRTVPVDSLLASHQQVMRKNAEFGSVLPTCLMPTADGRIPDWLDNAERIVDAVTVTDIMVTVTRDETAAYFFNSRERYVTMSQVRRLGSGQRRTYHHTPYAELVARTTASLFGDHANGLITAARARGIGAELREFDVSSTVAGLGSCHGFDTPFLFGNREAWTGAQFLDGIDDDLFEAVGSKLRADLADFVHRPATFGAGES